MVKKIIFNLNDRVTNKENVHFPFTYNSPSKFGYIIDKSNIELNAIKSFFTI